MALRMKKMNRIAGSQGIDLSVLQKEEGIADGKNLGGSFRLPDVFDTKTLASAFYKKGQEAESRRARKLLEGTEYSADGWEYWKYPDNFHDKELAGKHHEVAQVDGVYVLMCRDLEVQKAVNFIFGQHSQDRMNAEVHGETAAGSTPQDGGILTSDRLSSDRSMRAEQERDEAANRSVATFAGQQPRPRSKVITKKTKRLAKS